MYLKQIEMNGFKSFADASVLTFEKGITAIVGPNGSGKSNIVEAIRWVLGEQRAKQLRSEKMSDVIFSGSKQRRPKAFAEVSLIFDNTDQSWSQYGAEIKITRRLNRAGESRYFINGKEQLRREVQALFAHTGLGKNSFALISQGKIESILDEKPEERRLLFEEAAGVAQYKERKQKSEQKLKETDAHLARLADILYELEQQQQPLAKAAAKAQTAQQYERTLEKRGKQIHAWELADLKTQYQKVQAQGKKAVQQLQEEVQQASQLEQERQANEERLAKVSQEGSEWAEKEWAATRAYEAWNTKLEVAQEKQKQRLLRLEEQVEQVEQAEANLVVAQQKEKEKDEIFLQTQTEVEVLQEKFVTIQAQVQQLEKTADFAKTKWQERYLSLVQEKVELANTLQFQQKNWQQRQQSQQDLQKEKLELQEEVKAKKADCTEKDKQLQKAERVLAEKDKQQNTLQQKKHTLAQQYAEQKRKVQALEKSCIQAETEKYRQEQRQEEYASYHEGVRAILKNKKLAGIYGVVAQLAQVDPLYQQALEVALGNQAQHLVVADEVVAKQAIHFLKAKRKGRASFIPLTILQERKVPLADQKQAQTCPDFLGRASDFLHFPKQYTGLAEALVGQILVTKTLDGALQVAQLLKYKYKVVTLEGEVVHSGGTLTGGRQKKERHLLKEQEAYTQAKNRWQEAVQKKEAQAQRLTTIEQQLATLEQKQADQQKEVEMSKAQWQAQVEAYKKAHFALEQAQKNEQALHRLYQAEQQESQDLQKEIHQKEAQVQAKEKEAQAVQAAMAEAQAKSGAQKAKLQEAKAEQERLAIQLEVKKQALHYAKEEKIAATAQRKQSQQTCAIAKEKEATLAKADESLATYQKEKEAAALEMKVAKIKKERLLQQEEQERQQKDDLQKRKAERLLAKQRAELRVEQLLQEKTQIETSLQQLLQSIQKTYAFSAEQLQKEVPLTFDIQEAKAEYVDAEQHLKQLGSVDQEALSRYEQVAERYQFMKQQEEDLLAAKAQLKKSIAFLDREVSHGFLTCFQQIAEAFARLFPKMFHGGKAELVLTNKQDIFNTGVEIFVEPRGKSKKALRLLSGGERALTALTLLLAIIEVRPVPFCLLDEVEAALDEANVRRFAQYLKEETAGQQLFLITHRKGTMEVAQYLYGVTMDQSGTSRFVSVELEENMK